MKGESSSIHPELQTIARLTPRFSYSKKNLWLMRWLISLIPASSGPNVLIRNIHIPAEDGHSIRLRIYTPKSAARPTPVLLWLHGGGYVMGTPEMDDRRCIDYARQVGVSVVSVDYPHAPKYPFPAALDDCTEALMWVEAQAEVLGADPNRIAIGGASAGGGLAAALAQVAHDHLTDIPIFQLLVYPMLDDRTALRTDLDDSLNKPWDQMSNRFGWESYLGMACGAQDVPEDAVPARRADLSGLPPAWIGVGSLDIFHDENIAYAARLKECGVACELNVVPGAFHGFDVIKPQLHIVQDFKKSQLSALKKAFSG